ncbi:HTR-like protein [Halobacteriales archaeon QS_4_69_34]|nr:MAG: HTR-like protein [Halobacteriales archaeon QS_4_69_34]
MARTAGKVRSLVAEDDTMADALGAVLERSGTGDATGASDATDGASAESNAGADGEHVSDGGTARTVAWSDVSDDLTSGQWGRLIETGILVDGDGDGFVLDDPEGVREALDEDDSTAEEDSGWSTYDKLAALGALAFFPAYWFPPIRDTVGSAMDLFLGPLNEVLPFYAVVIVLSVLTGLYSTHLQANLMNTEKMGEMQAKMSDIQERRKEAKERGDDAAVERIQEEQMDAMGDQLGMFKEQFRPMVWIMLLTIPVFVWMYWMVGFRGGAGQLPQGAGMVLPIVGPKTWNASVLGPIQAWLVWYFLCSIGFRQIIQKSLNIQTTPSSS